MWVKKIHPEVFWHFFPNGWEFLVQILHAYYTFLSTLDYKFLFNYLQLWLSYAILSATTQFTSYAQCPSLAETHAFRCLRKSLITLFISYHHIISYHIAHFSGASSKTEAWQAPQPLNKQVSFQQCCKCSRRQCRVTNADWQAIPDAWAGDGKWSVT